MNGFLCVLKPPGMTSSDVVVRVRRRLPKGTKVGHAGTLDPEAAGVLPLMIGKASRLFDYLVEKEKVYIAELKPGYATDTQDAHGSIVAGSGETASLEQLEAVLPQFLGEIMQTPPMFSALKRDGQKLCDLARKGVTVELEARPTQVHAIDVLHVLPQGGFMLRVRCGKGTYIRSICSDMGDLVGCPAHMRFLLRAKSGAFDLATAMTLEEITALAQAGTLQQHLLPLDMPIQHLPRVDAGAWIDKLVRNGVKLAVKACKGAKDLQEGQATRVYLHDQFWGMAVREGDFLLWRAQIAPEEEMV